MTIERLQFIRRIVFLTIGLVCVGYAAAYLQGGLAEMLNPFVPGLVGLAGAVVLFGASMIGGRPVASAVFDELSRAEWSKALKFGYWFAVGLYPLFGLLMWLEIVERGPVFAVMGLLTGGVPLLFYCWLDVRG